MRAYVVITTDDGTRLRLPLEPSELTPISRHVHDLITTAIRARARGKVTRLKAVR